MAVTSCRLECDGLDPLELDPYDGWVIQDFDPGDPVTREAVTNAPDANGTIDSTRYIGARAITIALKLAPSLNSAGLSKAAMRRRLRSFTTPDCRPIIYFQIDDEPELRTMLRRSQFTSPLGLGAGPAPVVVQWIAPTGVLEAATLSTGWAFAAEDSAPAGRTYPLTFPRVYPAADPDGILIVTNNGDMPAAALIRLHGPATDPTITNLTLDRAMVFDGLTIAAGHYVELDTRAHTILYDSDPADSRYDDLVAADSAWFDLAPGDNELRYTPATYTTALTQFEIDWRDTYL